VFVKACSFRSKICKFEPCTKVIYNFLAMQEPMTFFKAILVSKTLLRDYWLPLVPVAYYLTSDLYC
jgi:hypothetical protein